MSGGGRGGGNRGVKSRRRNLEDSGSGRITNGDKFKPAWKQIEHDDVGK